MDISSFQNYRFTLDLYDLPANEETGHRHCGLNEVSLGDKWGKLSDVFGEDKQDLIWLGERLGETNTWSQNDSKPSSPLCVIWE